MKRILNWKPDSPDYRDKLYATHREGLKLTRKAKPLPKSVDLRPLCSPVVDQEDMGSCTGNSLAGHIEFLELKELKGNNPIAPQKIGGTTFSTASRLFIYYNERLIEGDVNADNGAMLRTGIKALKTYGICPEVMWPYAAGNEFSRPSPKSYQEAANHKISLYLRIESFDEMKHCLAQGYPFVFGVTLYDSFQSPQTAQTGIVQMPSTRERPIGGHAVMAVGYDDARRVVIVRNSWGTSWGDKGYFYLPYDYISNGNLAEDFWTIRL